MISFIYLFGVIGQHEQINKKNMKMFKMKMIMILMPIMKFS